MKKIYSILAACLALVATSCNEDKFFELERPNQYPWQTVEELEMAVRAPYLYMNGQAWGNPMGHLILRGFAESDAARYNEGVTGNNYFETYVNRDWANLVIEEDGDRELGGAFKYCYYISKATNAPLQLISDAEAEGKDVFDGMTASDKTLLQRYKGELLFMRAVGYYYLARTWCPPYDNNGSNDGRFIVLRRSYVANANEMVEPELATVEEVYASIIQDLKDAIACLPADYAKSDNNQRMRVNKYAAEAMLARVYFYMGKFADAKPLLDDVIKQTSLYNLDEDPIAAFDKTSGTGFSKEIVWELCLNTASSKIDRIPGIMGAKAYNTNGTGMSGYCSFSMSHAILQQIGWMDADGQVTEAAKADKRYQQLYRWADPAISGLNAAYYNQIFVNKYFRKHDSIDSERRANRPIIRLADLLLMRAQINWMNNDKNAAASDVNAVRRRAGLAEIASGSLKEIDIENERVKEMTGENGDRIYWLIALHREIPIGDRNPATAKPVKYPYSDYYYHVPILEAQFNNAYAD